MKSGLTVVFEADADGAVRSFGPLQVVLLANGIDCDAGEVQSRAPAVRLSLEPGHPDGFASVPAGRRHSGHELAAALCWWTDRRYPTDASAVSELVPLARVGCLLACARYSSATRAVLVRVALKMNGPASL